MISGRTLASAIPRRRASSCGVHRLLRLSTMEGLFPLRLQPRFYLQPVCTENHLAKRPPVALGGQFWHGPALKTNAEGWQAAFAGYPLAVWWKGRGLQATLAGILPNGRQSPLTTPATLILLRCVQTPPCYPIDLRRRWYRWRRRDHGGGFQILSLRPAPCRPIEPARVPERGPFSLVTRVKDFWR